MPEAGFVQKVRHTHRKSVALTKTSKLWRPLWAPVFLLVSGLILQFWWEGKWEKPMEQLTVALFYSLVPIALYFIGYYH